MGGKWILHLQDSASSHTAFMREFLAKNNITIDYHLYLPDLVTSVKVKNIMRDEHFVAIDIKREMMKFLKELTKEDMLLGMGETLDQVYSVKGRVLRGPHSRYRII